MEDQEHCPQCGEPTDEFREGYCVPCCEANQAALDLHNATFDRWKRMTPEQREAEIRAAIALAEGEE